METKENPNPNGCLAKALPDEPMFILLARDPSAPDAIRRWCDLRALDGIETEKRQDAEQLEEAFATADAMEAWRLANDGRWKDPAASPRLSDIEAVAREIWRFSEVPWDFDKPDSQMGVLQRGLAVDQAACIIAVLEARRIAGDLPPIEIDRSTVTVVPEGEAVRIGGRVLTTPRGCVQATDAPGFTSLTVNHVDPTISKVAIMLYDPPADQNGIGTALISQMEPDLADGFAASLVRLAASIRESRRG